MLLGCEKQIPYNASNFKKKLVVNATLESGVPIQIRLSESVNPVQVPVLYGLTGEVTYLLREDSVVIDYQITFLENGLININKSPKKGKIYDMEIAMNGYPSIKMIDTVPTEQPLFEIDTLYKQGNDYKLKLNLEDMLGKQVYMMTMRVHGTQINGTDTFETNYPLDFLSNDKVFLKNINNASTSGNFGLFDDQLFDGSSKSIELEVDQKELQIDGFRPIFVEVNLANVSKTMYNYYVALLENNHIYGGPLATYSLSNGNVYDGLGLFAFYTATKKYYTIP